MSSPDYTNCRITPSASGCDQGTNVAPLAALGFELAQQIEPLDVAAGLEQLLDVGNNRADEA